MQKKGRIRYLLLFFAIFSFMASAFSLEKGPEPSKVVLVITDKSCKICSCSQQEKFLREIGGNVSFREIDYHRPQAKRMIKNLNLETLPAFVADPALFEKSQYKKIFFFRHQHLILRKPLSGIFLFLKRKGIPKKADLFVDISSANYLKVIKVWEDFKREGWKINIHILPFSSQNREYARVWAAIRYLYPHRLSKDTLSILKAFKRIWWQSDLEKLGFNVEKIQTVAASDKIKNLLENSRKLAEELNVDKGGVILVNNRYIFFLAGSDKDGIKIQDLLKSFNYE